MGRKILFVTTDQQRYDAIGANGGTVGRTPVIDALAAQGRRYERAHPQSVVCMPSRSTIITGQHPSTHGVWMNGVPLAPDAPSVVETLHDAGYRTALIGKPHFEPFLDPFLKFPENQFSTRGLTGLHRGFEHFEAATHGGQGMLHYARWLAANHPEAVRMFYPVLDGALEVNAMGGGETDAPQVWVNDIPREWYHTDWVADRTISWLDSLDSARIGSSRAITQLILNLVEGTPILLVDGGKQRRCFTDVDEGIEALWRVVANEGGAAEGGIFNIGNPDNEASIEELAQMVVDAFERHPLRPFYPPFAGFQVVESARYYGNGYEDVQHRRPSIRNAQRSLGWTPKISFDELVSEMVREDLKAAERDELVKKHGYKAMDYHE